MTAPVRLVQVGVGGWGRSWAAIGQRSPHVELVALVDRDPVALRDVGEEVGMAEAQRHACLSDALERVEADAVLVAVPPSAHPEVAHEALDAGLHCLVEKPLAETMDEAVALAEHGERAGRHVMVSQNYRWRRGPLTVRDLVARGVLGEIGAVYVHFRYAPSYSGFRIEMDDPLIVDLAVHHFDQIRGVLGLEPLTVRARSFNTAWSGFAGHASANAEFTCAGGAVVSYTATWTSRLPETSWDGDWEVHADRGGLSWSGDRITFYAQDLMDTVFLPGTRQVSGNRIAVDLTSVEYEDRFRSLQELAEAIREDREPETRARDNLRSLALVLGAVASTRTGAPVDLSAGLLEGTRTP